MEVWWDLSISEIVPFPEGNQPTWGSAIIIKWQCGVSLCMDI